MSGDPIEDYMAEVGHEGATAEQLGRIAGYHRPHRRSTTLTDREMDVLRERALCDSYADTAHRLGVSEGTVRTHLANAYVKLDVTNLTAAYVVLGWLNVPAPRSSAPQAIPTDGSPPHRGSGESGLRPAPHSSSSGTPAGRTTGESAA